MVAVKMGGMMPPMGGMPQPMNMMPPPMPVPPMGQPMMPTQQGTAPVAPIMRSNAGRRKRFGDSLEGMLATTRPPPVASDQMAGMNVFTGQMPRGQMMGGTAMQPPVRRMMGGGSVPVPRQTDIYGQPHMLAYINPTEASLLEGLGGMGTPGPGGVPQYNFFSDFFSAITGGGSSSSSSSRSGQDNNPNAGDGGGMETILNDGRSSIGSAASRSNSTSDANKAFAESMIAGGGGTNLSGSGSTAMEKLVAAQQAQTQKDDGPPPDVTGSFSSPPIETSYTSGSVIDRLEKQRREREAEQERIRLANQKFIADQAAAEAEMGLDIFGGAGPDVTPTTNTGVVGGYDTLGIGSSDDPLYTPPSSITIDDTPPSDITGSFSSPGDLNFLDPSVLYYDIDGVPHNTSAEQQSANRLINERKAREQEEQRIAQVAQLEAEAAAEAARAQAERERIAQQAIPDELMTEPFNNANVTPTSLPDELSGVPFNTTQERVVDALQNFPDELTTTEFNNAINLGLGDPDATKNKKDGEEDDDRSFLEKLVDDVKAVPGNIMRDLQMGIAAGFYGNDYGKARTNLEKVLNADGSRKYSDAQIDAWIAATKDTKKKQMDEQKRLSDQDGDDPKDVVGDVVDPCPTGFKLDPASGICVPVEEDDTDEDSGDDKEEDTSDDELSGVVRTPPPPTSYLDNPIRMNRGGSVGLNRAADNFLAAMGA